MVLTQFMKSVTLYIKSTNMREFPLPISCGYGSKGQWKVPVSRNNHTLTVILYRYNTFIPVYIHLLSFL